ncbi:PREDICTED: uncharacterized protein LOC105449551 [Wasmannia auropunctata]|uniref:uncharacterized protein LOC105449551 n=1 Tax=Wasmannia auropunctata TaxID=64793 RepID=UPI0005EE116C|nr:PREDICTED: uncharacterized protein LOC105449551 [Wasmannia auropunctata]
MLVSIIKHGAFFYNSRKMKHLINLIWYHWTIIQDKQEIAILEKYTKFSRRFTIFILHAFALSMFIMMIGHIWPVILDTMVPLNSSRPRHFYILVECFIDEEKYFFWLLLHTILTISTALIMMISVGTMLMSCIFHACAMFKIASYRIRHAVTEDFEASSSQKDHAIYKKIINGVHIQRKAIEFADLIVSDMKIPFFILLTVGIASLVLNIFQICVNRIEERIKALQERKLEITKNELSGGKKNASTKLALNDLKSLFGF